MLGNVLISMHDCITSRLCMTAVNFLSNMIFKGMAQKYISTSKFCMFLSEEFKLNHLN